MIKKSLNTGVIPNNWKTAHVVPIYKKDPKYYSESNSVFSDLNLLQTTRAHIVRGCCGHDCNHAISAYHH